MASPIFGNPNSSSHLFDFPPRRILPLPQPTATSSVVPAPRSTNVDDIRSEEGLKLLRNSTSVLVTVGNAIATTSWSIPRDLLTHHSPFLDNVMWDNQVALPEDDPDTFELFVKWLYAGGIDIEATKSEPYVKAWILGDKLKCLTFRDHAMLHILHCHKEGKHPEHPISPQSLLLAYNKTEAKSKLRQWALDQFMFHSSKGSLSGQSEEWAPVLEECRDLAEDTTRALMRLGSQGIENPYKQGHKYLEVLKYADFCDSVQKSSG